MDIQNYEPPPMFRELPSATLPKQELMKDSDYTRIISGTTDILPAINKASTGSQKRIAHIKPPLPPKRPAKFAVSPEFLDGMRVGNVHKSEPFPLPSAPENMLEITPMSADDVYRTLSDSGLE